MSGVKRAEGGKAKTIYLYDKHIKLLEKIKETDNRSDSMIILEALEKQYANLLSESVEAPISQGKVSLIDLYRIRKKTITGIDAKKMQIAWLKSRLEQFKTIERFRKVQGAYELYEILEGEMK